MERYDDFKHILKAFNLSQSQKRLFNAITREPTGHLYAAAYMARHQLTRGGIASGLRRLIAFNVVSRGEDGIWQIQPPGLRQWWKVVLEGGSFEAEHLRFGDFCARTSGVCSTLWRVAPIDEEPEIVLKNWTVFEVTTELWPEKTRHFVGYDASGREGEVSSAIVKFDSEKAVGMTKSGRIYQLQGSQGSGSSDGLYVWHFWCLRNDITKADETSLAN